MTKGAFHAAKRWGGWGRVLRWCWAGIVTFLISAANAQPRPASQTPDEVRTVLRAWDWEGEWFMDCEHPDKGGHYIAALSEKDFPAATMFYDGKLTSEGRVIAAHIESDGALSAVTESHFKTYLLVRTTTFQVNRDDSLRLFSAEGEFDAIADMPPHSFYLKPEGMARGTHLHVSGVKDGMVLDRFEEPVRATATYYRCGKRVS